ncbi:MAG: hypothetical protein ACK4TL_02275 [Hyphomicrobiaceae bacterium]
MPTKSDPLSPREMREDDIEVVDELSRADQLEYLADLTLELKDIADNLGCATLAGILVVAYREAIIQAQRS